MVRPTVHTGPFTKTLFKTSGIWKRRLCILVWTEYILMKGLFCHYDSLVISLNEFSSTTNPKWPVVVAFSFDAAVSVRVRCFDIFSSWRGLGLIQLQTWRIPQLPLSRIAHLTWFLIPVTFPRRKSRCWLVPINSHNEAPKKRMQWVMNMYCHYLQVWIKTCLNQ